MRIYVTENDINGARGLVPWDCAIARAFKREFPGRFVSVSPVISSRSKWKVDIEGIGSFNLPTPACDLAREFDEWKSSNWLISRILFGESNLPAPKPMSFEIDLGLEKVTLPELVKV